MLEGPLTLLTIDAWRDPDGGWTWNAWYKLEAGIFLTDPTPRKVLAFLRRAGYLTEASKGRVRVDMGREYMDATLIEIQNKNTGEPLLALSNLHGG